MKTFIDRVTLEDQKNRLLDMRALYNDGLKVREIAARLKTSAARVSRILRGHAYQEAHTALGLTPVLMRPRGGPFPAKPILSESGKRAAV